MAMILKTVGPARGAHWVRDGLRLYLKRPLAFTSLFVLFLFAALFAALVPVIGGVLQLMLVPLLSLGFMVASQSALLEGPVRPLQFLEPLRGTPAQSACAADAVRRLRRGGGTGVAAVRRSGRRRFHPGAGADAPQRPAGRAGRAAGRTGHGQRHAVRRRDADAGDGALLARPGAGALGRAGCTSSPRGRAWRRCFGGSTGRRLPGGLVCPLLRRSGAGPSSSFSTP
jgi:hypothetical protein